MDINSKQENLSILLSTLGSTNIQLPAPASVRYWHSGCTSQLTIFCLATSIFRLKCAKWSGADKATHGSHFGQFIWINLKLALCMDNFRF